MSIVVKYLHNLVDYWQYKIFAGLIASIFSESFFKLISIFVLLEILDIFSRWICESKKCWQALYPNTKVGITKYIGFMLQARKWHFIQSDKLRSGSDKLLIYLLLILTSTLVDTALTIGNAKVFTFTALIVGFLSTTEGLSIIENISEIAEYDVIDKIKNKLKSKVNSDAISK